MYETVTSFNYPVLHVLYLTVINYHIKDIHIIQRARMGHIDSRERVGYHIFEDINKKTSIGTCIVSW